MAYFLYKVTLHKSKKKKKKTAANFRYLIGIVIDSLNV